MIHLKSHSDIVRELSDRMRVPGDDPWTTREMNRAINAALRQWSRVKVPYIYSIPGGFTHNSFTVALPDYIDHRFIRPQIKSTALDASVDFGDNTLETWVTLPGWSVEPNSSGGYTIRIEGMPYTEDGRILFYQNPMELPVFDEDYPTLTGDVAADDTSLTVSTDTRSVSPVGYVLVNGEWMQYAGLAGNAAESTWTLSNLVRNVYFTGSVSGTHTTGDTVEWGVPADDVRLYEQLFTKAEAYMHRMMLVNGSPNEKEDHKWAMRYLDAEADGFWSNYLPSWQPRLNIKTRTAFTGLETR